jgi:hypothetical protein
MLARVQRLWPLVMLAPFSKRGGRSWGRFAATRGFGTEDTGNEQEQEQLTLFKVQKAATMAIDCGEPNLLVAARKTALKFVGQVYTKGNRQYNFAATELDRYLLQKMLPTIGVDSVYIAALVDNLSRKSQVLEQNEGTEDALAEEKAILRGLIEITPTSVSSIGPQRTEELFSILPLKSFTRGTKAALQDLY